jgi:uncharacterized damage-inducible protein DinB
VTPALTFDELLHYTNEERDKWRAWFVLHPGAIDAPVQPGARFATAGKLVDHIFLIERRHLQRLQSQPVVEQTGLTGNNAAPLFDYGASVRRELDQYAANLSDDPDEVRTFDIRGVQMPLTTRKLLFHVLLHEIRHWAQIATAVRLAGFEPPGDHDLLFSAALK